MATADGLRGVFNAKKTAGEGVFAVENSLYGVVRLDIGDGANGTVRTTYIRPRDINGTQVFVKSAMRLQSETTYPEGINLIIDGETGVDGVIFPNRTKQTTAANTLAVFTPQHFIGPSTSFAYLTVHSNNPVLVYSSSTTTNADFHGVVPQNYSGTTLEVRIFYALANGTTADGNIVWQVQFQRQADSTYDLDSDSFATALTVTSTPGDGGIIKIATVTFTNSQADSIQAGDGWRVRLLRDPSHASDTDTHVAEFFKMEIRNV